MRRLFRVPNTRAEDGISAVSLTALAGGLTVELAYNPSVTTGCGTEPKLRMFAGSEGEGQAAAGTLIETAKLTLSTRGPGSSMS